jgi:plastocyanin
VSIFFFAAAILAAWAVSLTVLGLRHPGFPGKEGGARIVATVSFVLAAAGFATAVISAHEEEVHEEAEAKAEEAAPEPGTSAAERPLRVAVDPSGQLRFEQAELVTSAGPTTIELTNAAPIEHNIGIVGNGVDVVSRTVGQGQRATVSAPLRPGRYTFYCSVLGHRQGGMEGALIVR